jgi:hypothetical protein
VTPKEPDEPDELTPTPPEGASDAEAEGLHAMTQAEFAHLEALLPGEPEQEILDYMKGAGIGLPEIVALTVDAGALAIQVEHQAATIRALQARLAKMLAAAKRAAAKREGLPE